PTRRSSDLCLQSRKTFFHGTARSVELHVCLPVERLPSLEYPPQVFHCLIVPRDSTKIPLLKHARHVLLRLGLNPNRVAMREEVVKGFFFRNHSSTHRQNRAFVLTEHFRQGALLDCSIPGLSIERKYFSERHSRLLLDFAIQLDERDAQFQRQF